MKLEVNSEGVRLDSYIASNSDLRSKVMKKYQINKDYACWFQNCYIKKRNYWTLLSINRWLEFFISIAVFECNNYYGVRFKVQSWFSIMQAEEFYQVISEINEWGDERWKLRWS